MHEIQLIASILQTSVKEIASRKFLSLGSGQLMINTGSIIPGFTFENGLHFCHILRLSEKE